LDWIKPLADISLADLDHVGSKAAHLGSMLQAGYPVPDGFVIPIDAFIAHFGDVTDPLIRPNPPRLQPELMASVVDAIMRQLGDVTQLTVRSSTADSHNTYANFAGQHSTYYFVPPGRIDQAIIDCWMSLWSNAALSYRRAGWLEVLSGKPLRAAVIIQRMIPADRAGIICRDPQYPERAETFIEASWGLGAAITDGRVMPDQARLSATNELLSYVVNDKVMQVRPDPHDDTLARLQEVPEERRQSAVLSETEIKQLGHISTELEHLFEQPQEIEWAYEGEQLYVLQSRPVTNRAEEHAVADQLVVFKPLTDGLDGPLTPLSEDLYARVMPKVGAMYQGRFYLKLKHIQHINLFNLDDKSLADWILLRKRPRESGLSWRKLAVAAGWLSVGFLVDGANWIRTLHASPAALKRYESLVDRVKRNPRITPPEALKQLIWGRQPFSPIGHQLAYARLSGVRYFVYVAILRRLVKYFAPDYPIVELAQTYHGNQALTSLTLLNEIDHLSSLLKSALAKNDTGSAQLKRMIRGEAHTLPADSPFTMAFEEFIHRHGHRGPNEMELAIPAWREAPVTFLRVLLNNPSQSLPSRDRHGEYLSALNKLHDHLKPWQRTLVDQVLNHIHAVIESREGSRHYHSMLFDVVRQKILDIEQHLLAQGYLKIPGDIFFLTYAEIQALSQSTLNTKDAHDLIRMRRRERRRLARLPIQETVNLEATPDPLATHTSTIAGECACPGRVEAIARVVASLSQSDKLNSGEILVARHTDSAWTPLVNRAAGIIVASGSTQSHAGKLARELHIPCIVDVVSGFQLIKDGQRIRLNADQGTVEILTQ